MDFINSYNKNYLDKEDHDSKKENFFKNKQVIDELNSDPDDSATYGFNWMADLSDDEYQKILG